MFLQQWHRKQPHRLRAAAEPSTPRALLLLLLLTVGSTHSAAAAAAVGAIAVESDQVCVYGRHV